MLSRAQSITTQSVLLPITLLLDLTLALFRMIPDRRAYDTSILLKTIGATQLTLKSMTEERSDASILITNSGAATGQQQAHSGTANYTRVVRWPNSCSFCI